MNPSSIPQGTFIGKLLRAPLRVLPPSARVPILQGPARGKRWIVGSADHGCWLGSYEYFKSKRFQQEVRPGSIVFDIGAHAGYYTLIASLLVGTAGRVVSFEPEAGNVAHLRQHVHLNHLDNVVVEEAAVGATSGKASWSAGPSSTTGSLKREGSTDVKVWALDDYLPAREIDRVDLFKIDVEGGEADVLAGAKETLRKHQPIIFLATHGEEVRRRCLKSLEELGYDVAPLDGEADAADEHLARPRAGR